MVAGSLTYDTKMDTNGFQKGIDKITSKTQSGGTKIKNIIAALGITKIISTGINVIMGSIGDAISRLDILNNYPKVMSNLGVSADKAQASIDKMSDKLSGLPTTLDSAAISVQRFTSANNDVQKSTDYFLALNNALLAGGASAGIQESAMEQLSQAYAKGKPDAMEWRSILTAMPGQLKQVAQQLGYTSTAVGGDLYEAIQKGTISMDDFMGAIVQLNEKGIDGFQSFEEQARNSTDGIATAIKVAKTQIVKGVTDILKSFNQVLKDKGLGGIGQIISNIGKKAKEALDIVANNMPKIIKFVENVFKVLKKLSPLIISIVSALVAYKATLIVITAINFAKYIAGTVTAFISLIPAITSAKDAMLLLNMAMNANPVGIVVAGVTALAGALAYLTLRQTDAQKNAKALAQEMADAKKSFDDYNNSVDENRDKSLSQINTAEALKNQLSKLVDENGKVKEGYQSRVDFILGQLNDALGTEYSRNGDIIEQYQKMQGEIDSIIAKKKAQIILEAEGEKYAEWVKNHAQAVENFKKAQDDLGTSYETAEAKVKGYQAAIEAAGGTSSIVGMQIEKEKKALENKMQAYRDADDVVKNGVELENQYQQMLVDYTNENYAAIAETVTVKTQDWTNFSTTELLKSLNQQEQDLADYRNAYALHHDELERKDMEAAEKNVANLKGLIAERTGIRQEAFAEEIPEWGDLGQKSSDMFGQNIQKIQGNTNEALQKTENAIHSDKKVQDAMVQLAKETDEGYNNNVDGNTWGGDLVKNIADGITGKKSLVEVASEGVAGIIKGILGHSVPSMGPLKDELTYMPDMINNLVKGINDNKYKVQRATNLMAQDMKSSLENAVNIETGKMNASATIRSNNMYNNVIQLNAKFEGNVEMDKRKTGQILAPEISKTIKVGGLA